MLPVYVPKADTYLSSVAVKGSGIVGQPESEQQERFVVNYEGGIYDQENVQTFEEKLYHAADRMLRHYPTTAKCMVNREDVMLVGYFDYANQKFTQSGDKAARDCLDKWLEG